MGKDFLNTITAKKIKKEIRNICDSYSNAWDIFAELAQNSVDAIARWNELYSDSSFFTKNHIISITIDRYNHSVEFYDSGIGFDPEKAATYLAPNNGDKDEDEKLIGEKGVGLTFAVFSSNHFKLDTRSVKGNYIAEIQKARDWRDNNDYSMNSMPQIINESIKLVRNEPKDTYTKILLEDLSSEYDGTNLDFFKMSKERIIYYLRTKTAIGSTKKRFKGIELRIDVTLNIKNNNSLEESGIKIPAEYLFLDDFFDKRNILDLNEYFQDAALLSDDQKRKKLQNKCLIMEGKEDKDKYKYYCFFAYSTEVWTKICQTHNLFSTQDGIDINDITHFLTISTKGMPTGFEIPPPVTGASGYWNNLFAIVEYDNIKFDIGRKYIHGKILNPIIKLIKEKFNKFSSLKIFLAQNKRTPSPIPAGLGSFQQKQNEFARLQNELPDINLPKIKFQKFPDKQEAAVSAIFHELLGAGIMTGYYALREGYKQNYDFWGVYKIDKNLLGKNIKNSPLTADVINHPIIIEYKYEAASIIPDVDNDIKRFSDIDLIVCWEINHAEFKKNGIDVNVINKDDVYYYGSNYTLDWPGSFNLGKDSQKYVIALKQFIEDYKKG